MEKILPLSRLLEMTFTLSVFSMVWVVLALLFVNLYMVKLTLKRMSHLELSKKKSQTI